MKNNEFKKMSVAELQAELHELLKEQFNLRVQKTTGQMSKTHLIKQVRKKIASLKTILSEKSQ